ncbi:MAG: sodium:proton antiporter NhaD [Chlamydiia bacterium]|nr:sodium:proton antiporter NhaD [Chlamydiia bacterium]
MELGGYDYLLMAIFCLGYLCITFEHYTHVNKGNVALIMAVVSWSIAFLDQRIPDPDKQEYLAYHFSNSSQVIFFLLGALSIVEMVNVHQGFALITRYIRATSYVSLLWVFGFFTFFLSALLDNLTTTVVMLVILQRLVLEREIRWIIGSGIVIAANAGGAWSPIGDVTTTMLWIGGNITVLPLIQTLFLPSFVCCSLSLLGLQRLLPKETPTLLRQPDQADTGRYGKLLFFLGAACLIAVPILKTALGLPPVMGVLFGLGLVWAVSDILHSDCYDSDYYRMPAVMGRIDLSGILFFLGILLAVNALEVSGILDHLAHFLQTTIGHPPAIAVTIGFLSALIDNVPLVAGSIGMYDLTQFPPDDPFWQLIAYCAGTGGSLLIIGSVAGVAFMGLEKVPFPWYCRKITLPAMLGYLGGIAVWWLL